MKREGGFHSLVEFLMCWECVDPAADILTLGHLLELTKDTCYPTVYHKCCSDIIYLLIMMFVGRMYAGVLWFAL